MERKPDRKKLELALPDSKSWADKPLDPAVYASKRQASLSGKHNAHNHHGNNLLSHANDTLRFQEQTGADTNCTSRTDPMILFAANDSPRAASPN